MPVAGAAIQLVNYRLRPPPPSVWLQTCDRVRRRRPPVSAAQPVATAANFNLPAALGAQSRPQQHIQLDSTLSGC
jgi:hypothetical protein